MNEISKVFQNEEFGDVRVVMIDGEPWFVGVDIAKPLGYADPRQAIHHNCKKAIKVDLYAIQGHKTGNSEMLVIPESDVYRLIIKSKRPEAEKFEEWVMEYVLPSIRKTGGYVNNEEVFIETYLEGVSEEVKQLFRDHLAVIKEKNAKIKEMQPKADYYDDLVATGLATNIRDTAKELGIGERKFIEWLLDRKYVYRMRNDNIRPYADYVKGDRPPFIVRDVAGQNGYGTIQTFITIEGKNRFRKRLLQEFEPRANMPAPVIEHYTMVVPVMI